MDRKCNKCGETEDALSDQFIDLLEDSQKKCPFKFCEKCVKNIVKATDCTCGKKPNEHKISFKHYSIIDFEKEQV